MSEKIEKELERISQFLEDLLTPRLDIQKLRQEFLETTYREFRDSNKEGNLDQRTQDAVDNFRLSDPIKSKFFLEQLIKNAAYYPNIEPLININKRLNLTELDGLSLTDIRRARK